MKFLKKNSSNILFLTLLALLIIPQTRMPIQVFVQRLIAFNPSETEKEDRTVLDSYNWNLTRLNSEEVNFSQSEKKVVLINFWATWCPPCVAEMPSLQKLHEAYGSKVDFYFVTSEELPVIQKFMEKHNYTFPVYIQKYIAPEGLETSVLPTTYVLSKSGEIVIDEEGAADWNSEKSRNIFDVLLTE